VPNAPVIITVTPGNTELSISFTPGDNGGSPITDYEYSTNNGTDWTSSGTTSSPIIITGLTNGVTYQIRLRAININGNGTPSTAVSGTPSTIPSAPSIIAVTPGNTELSVSFTPGDDGGSSITNYEYSTNNGTNWTSSGTTSSPIIITGLTNGTTYQVRLRAININGNGTPSTAVSGTPVTTPSAPTGLTGSPGDQSAIISFTPGSNGGSPITNYQYSTDGGSTFIALSPADTASPVTITTLSSDGTTPLTNGVSYNIQLKAVTLIGVSPASASVNVTPVEPINVIILGNSRVTTLSTSIQSARIDLGYSRPLNITTQELNGYNGSNLSPSSFQVVILYTDGGLVLNAPLGANLDTFVSSGGHLIMASFCWGNVPALSGFTYDSYSTYQFKGTMGSVNTETAVYTIIHPITTGIPTTTGMGSQNIPNPISLTTIPNSQLIATFGDSNTTSFIATGQNGSSRLVGINAYVALSYGGNVRNTIKYVCNSIYWCEGLI
jgi:hypothetical protein